MASDYLPLLFQYAGKTLLHGSIVVHVGVVFHALIHPGFASTLPLYTKFPNNVVRVAPQKFSLLPLHFTKLPLYQELNQRDY